jgi:membrane-associated protein
LTDQIIGWLSLYGVVALFGILLAASIGAPLPVSLLLIAAGSFIDQGELKLWQVITAGSAGAIAGDQIGYALARWGGPSLLKRLTDRFGGADKVEQAENFARKWGGLGVFFSRWLITPLGPWVNLTSGISGYPWPRFLAWDVAGEILWVVLYVALGYFFSQSVQEVARLTGDLSWILLGTLAAGILGWVLVSLMRTEE